MSTCGGAEQEYPSSFLEKTMAIPTYNELMLPFLVLLSDGSVLHIRDIINRLSSQLKLTDEELAERIPSGQSTVFDNRIGWARTYLKKAGLIEPVSRGHYKLTLRGKEVVLSKPEKINSSFLKQFPEFLEFISPKGDDTSTGHIDDLPASERETPLEILERAHQRLRRELADELLQAVKSAPPSFFEHLVVEVLVAMGYGGSLKDAGKAVGRSGDDGVDGIIKEDRLGLDVVYVQAKRWSASVGRPEIQAFAGSLEGDLPSIISTS
jgi:restriction system protein